MPTFPATLSPLSFSSPLFSLETFHTKKATLLTMRLRTKEVSTAYFPKTHQLLRRHLPTILRAQCFNERNIPFRKELIATEIGHLFEHILLEYLCLFKLDSGYKYATFQGVTYWNWKEESYGTFHISISCRLKESLLFPKALDKSIKLLTLILNTQTPTQSFPQEFPQKLTAASNLL